MVVFHCKNSKTLNGRYAINKYSNLRFCISYLFVCGLFCVLLVVGCFMYHYHIHYNIYYNIISLIFYSIQLNSNMILDASHLFILVSLII